MSAPATAWFPFYVGDYLGDTQRLTTEQHGAYLLLILDYWRAGPPPDDDAVLQQITKLDKAGWKRCRPAIARMFQVVDAEWRHRRIDRELEAAARNAERRSSKARAAAEARWGNASDDDKQCQDDAASNATGMPQAMLGECPPQSQSPSTDVLGISDATHPHPDLRPEHVLEAWNDMAHRLGLATARLTPERRRKLASRLRVTTVEDWTEAISAVERSTFLRGDNDRGWRANFDFLLQPSTFTKMIEGTYDRPPQ